LAGSCSGGSLLQKNRNVKVLFKILATIMVVLAISRGEPDIDLIAVLAGIIVALAMLWFCRRMQLQRYNWPK
jgi:hypothetical protein